MFKYQSVSAVFCIIVIVVTFFSCSPQKKNTAYFQTIPYNSEIQTLITKDFEHKIKPDDILVINITSPSEEVKNYNTTSDNNIVDKNGRIQLYKLGEIKVSDLTLAQAKEKITGLLVPDYFKQASVSVRFRNHKVVMLGEIGSPGVIQMETEHLPLLEALSLRGDLKETAKRDNILVIRSTEKGKLFYRVNLLDGSVFNSNFYYPKKSCVYYLSAT